MINEDARKYVENMINEIIETDFKFYESLAPESVKKAKKCLNHIKCKFCLDTKRIVREEEGNFYGYWYVEYTCQMCTGSLNYIVKHHNCADAKGINGRQIPCASRRSGYSYTVNLARIYEIEYEKADQEKEKADAAIKAAEIAAINAAADAANELKGLEKLKQELKLEEERLKNERNELNEYKKPRFECQKFEEYTCEKKSVDVKVDISALVDKISGIIALSAGNVLALPNFLKGIDASLNLCWSNSSNKNCAFEVMKDDKDQVIYLRFDYMKITSEKKGSFNFLNFTGSKAKEYLYVSYLLLKPLNDAATQACEEMMRDDFQKLHDKMIKK